MTELRTTSSPEETEELGVAIAKRIGPSGVVLLEGELGAGKTTMVRGIARGLGIDPAEVASPTFALLNEYGDDGSGRPRLRHLDLYRLEGLESLREAGVLELLDEDVPVVIEWPKGRIPPVERVLRVTIHSESASVRRIAIEEEEGRGRVDESRSQPYLSR